ncbi:glycosyltransferase family 2 protein [Hanstruepera flava]|uniref:glycosyltransferase family 2 protein n=1 Tax=Hanstruepera flava TaxID=2930218 RepID=UPI002027DDAB|nr:glycosyltransferase family A protein [Hanstruepera flava]
MNPKLSIVIPCYNSESTLEDTLRSVFDQDFQQWEAIIVNDGSPDNLESIALSWVKKDSRFKYFKKDNGGLGSARNYGIEKARGQFILPLDSDNKVRPDFVGASINVMYHNEKVAVVYGDAMFFGDKNELWDVGFFDKYRMLQHNYIDACAVIRKSVYESIGGYDENLPHQGHEDWDFWLRVIKSDFTFYYLKQITFDYRVSSNSMIKTFDNDMMQENINYIKKKHYDLYVKEFSKLLNENKVLREKLSSTFFETLKKYLKRF